MTSQHIQDRLSVQIRAALRSSDMATSEVAAASGLSVDTIYRMRHGESLTIKNLHALAVALGMVLFVDIGKGDAK